MDQSNSFEANRSSAILEILRLLWNTELYFRIYKSLLPLPVLNQTNPVHASSRFFKIHFNIILPSTSSSNPASSSPLQ